MRIGITGGIGAGKTLVADVLSHMGYPVYNADTKAKWLIQNDQQLVSEITTLLGCKAYVDGEYNRKYVAERVFADSLLLGRLNSIVHPAVAIDFERWAELNMLDGLCFMEAAVLFESGFDRIMDKTIAVIAPDSIRIDRVVARDGIVREQVMARISKQMPSAELAQRADFIIHNDNAQLIVPQVVGILRQIKTIHNL